MDTGVRRIRAKKGCLLRVMYIHNNMDSNNQDVNVASTRQQHFKYNVFLTIVSPVVTIVML
jgi:hypothetical protein